MNRMWMWEGWYTLDANDDPVPVSDPGYRMPDASERTVARTVIGEEPDDIVISTVFLCLDHRFGDGPPILWETLVFGGPLDGEMDRYTSRAEAEAGHAVMVRRVQDALAKESQS